jgi:hypothetical protein
MNEAEEKAEAKKKETILEAGRKSISSGQRWTGRSGSEGPKSSGSNAGSSRRKTCWTRISDAGEQGRDHQSDQGADRRTGGKDAGALQCPAG